DADPMLSRNEVSPWSGTLRSTAAATAWRKRATSAVVFMAAPWIPRPRRAQVTTRERWTRALPHRATIRARRAVILRFEQSVAAPRESLFAFHANPANLARLLEGWGGFELVAHDGHIRPGARTRLRH